MKARRAAEIAAAVGGAVVAGRPDRIARGVSIDSRQVRPDDLFVAIRGPRHDGHGFAPDAAEAGASVVLADHRLEGLGDAALILVNDTTDALGALAADERSRRDVRVVAITGSSGKTTTRELTGAALSARYRTYTSHGNLNNQWGLPLSLLSIPERSEVAVLEMGMNHAGEIAALTRIASPDVGVITNIGSAHLGFFSSLRELAAAKAELFEEMPAGAVGVVNGDSALLMELATRVERKLIRFGLEEGVELRATNIAGELRGGMRFSVSGTTVSLRLWGRHAVLNALAALGAAQALDVPLEDAAARLADVAPMAGRGRLHALVGGSLLVDDAYNSNPTAVRAVAEALAGFEWRGRRIAVVGDMLELGDHAAELHREVGRVLGKQGIDRLLAVGSFAAELAEGARETRVASISEHADAESALGALVSEMSAGDLIVVKGSRGVRLDRVVEGLLDRFAEGVRQ